MTESMHLDFSEGERIEFKEQWVEGAMKDLAAFANTEGGHLYIGVAADGEIVGCDTSDEVQQDISGKIRSHLGLSPHIKPEDRNDESFLVVEVTSTRAPVFHRGKLYRRSGSTTREVPAYEQARVILDQGDRSWDSMPADATIEKDINEAAVRKFLGMALSYDERRIPEAVSPEDPLEIVLHNLGFLQDGKPTKAAILLFGANPQSFFRGAFIRPLFFRSIDEVDEYDDCRGTAIDQLRSALAAVGSAYPAEVSVGGSEEGAKHGSGTGLEPFLGRSKLPFPRMALREALVNAIIHRDYARLGAHIELKMYPDRLVLLNPGGLPEGVSIDDLERNPHRSELRNPLLASGCKMAGLVESYGTGTLRIINECKENGLPAPGFEDEGGGFRLVLRRVAFTRNYLEEMDLRARQVNALLALQQQEFTREDYENETGLPRATAARDIKELREKDLLSKRGGGPHVRYRVKRRG